MQLTLTPITYIFPFDNYHAYIDAQPGVQPSTLGLPTVAFGEPLRYTALLSTWPKAPRTSIITTSQ